MVCGILAPAPPQLEHLSSANRRVVIFLPLANISRGKSGKHRVQGLCGTTYSKQSSPVPLCLPDF